MGDRMPLEVRTERFCGRSHSVWAPIPGLAPTQGRNETPVALFTAAVGCLLLVPVFWLCARELTDPVVKWGVALFASAVCLQIGAAVLLARRKAQRPQPDPRSAARPVGVPRDAVAVTVQVTGDGTRLGADLGWLWHERGWLHFLGLRSGFKVRASDFKGKHPLLGVWHRTRWSRVLVDENPVGWLEVQKGRPALGVIVRQTARSADREWILWEADQSRLAETLRTWHEAPPVEGQPIYPPMRHDVTCTGSRAMAFAHIPVALALGLFLNLVVWMVWPSLADEGGLGIGRAVSTTLGLVVMALLLPTMAGWIKHSYKTGLRRFERKWHTRHLE
jgi:hypothetical protein